MIVAALRLALGVRAAVRSDTPGSFSSPEEGVKMAACAYAQGRALVWQLGQRTVDLPPRVLLSRETPHLRHGRPDRP